LLSYREGGAVTGTLESLQSETLFTRSLGDFRAIGQPAAERVFTVLVGQRRNEERAAGILILRAIGDPALPRLLGGAKVGPTHQRRASIEALGGFVDRPEVAAAVRALAEAPEWEVRAEAMEALAQASEPASQSVLMKASRADADAFVRRKAIASLRSHRSPESAQAIVEFMQSAVSRGDAEDLSTARESLRQLAGADLGDLAAWRRWIAAGMPKATDAGR
jgi:HEAT repeat protein